MKKNYVKLRYQLDFRVFYNPRLSTEHKRIVRKIGKRSIFYDCCAGIGPLVLPVIRNGVHHVLANDLNPNCIDYLKRNMELNRYFNECRQIEVLKLNFCDFFTDKAIEHVVSGRPSRTLRNIEIAANPYISDYFMKGIKRIRGLQRAHFYFLPCVAQQTDALQSLKASLPCCRVSFPEIKEVGYGYGYNAEDSKLPFQ
ncbi:Met-10 like-protein [Brugia malayi]|uniref:Bm13389 n=1 Tax=Brugia malayi TaxID=6279 RepID=A0A0J9Y9A6_BRUMA|nr:Met-10 like-protein [Brugia malayi]CDQ04441.1 Bm13389 [Brugia malayi]VIO90673.1 Met-10 like-protein [Brugia malayi]